MSRKNAIGIWGTILLLVGAMNVHDLHWIAKSLTYPIIFYTFMFYWWVEGKKSLIKYFSKYLDPFYQTFTGKLLGYKLTICKLITLKTNNPRLEN
jgi:hypothetical protein